MERVLVTGATGSVGSNVCRLAREQGLAVRGLVRDVGAAGPLQDLGVELAAGDVTDADAVAAAAAGVDAIVHCAAQIGGTWTTATAADFEAVNQHGTFHVLDAAERHGVGRTVVLLSKVVCHADLTATEISPITPIGPKNSPYTRTKLAAYYEGMARAARGMDVNFVIPGGIFGPTPLIDRALVPTIYTGTLVAAARGELSSYLPHVSSFVLASDVAAVSLAAARAGRPGARYLALGRPEDVCSLPALCNRFLELAGIDHRVTEIDVANAGPEDLARFGSMLNYQRDSYPDPQHDGSATIAELGCAPTPLDDALAATLGWLREHGRV